MVIVLLLIVTVFISCFENGLSTSVSYDGRALVIDGKRRILQSGSIHYPRAMPDVWPELIRKSKEGGLDVIETYVFWNYHEPVRGQYYFEDRFDLVKFVKTVHEAGLFVHLRIGPYACAEWNYGGFPFWLHEIPNIQLRTNNPQFKVEMERFLTKIVNLMKEENLFAPQGGPIILAQVENEYGNVEWAYGIEGQLYIKWAADTAVNLNTSVPWVMCAQNDAPNPIINTCNGFYCDGFTPNSPSKPAIWTENYSGWFLSFGYAVPYRPVEDLAFAVARFFEKGGTFQNYYMYFGGTNFGRTAGGPLIATSYDYDAPLDEYGYISQPKWGHLRDLHTAIKHCEHYLVSTEPTQQSLGKNLEAHVYYKASNDCAAFLANYDSVSDANVTFNGNIYFLPAWSVSILPDCKNVIFNTAKVVSHRNLGDAPRSITADISEVSVPSLAWSWYNEKVGISGNSSFTASGLLEHINTTKDVSDFLWYTTSINVDGKTKKSQKENLHLLVTSLGHGVLVFVNKKLVGFGYGNHDEPSFALSKRIELNDGTNTLDMLSMMVGLQNYGPWFDISPMGITSVFLSDLKGSKENISSTEWTYQVGVEGEYLGLSNINLVNSPLWSQGKTVPTNQTLIWYKTTFLAPSGSGPISLDLGSMGKGQAWVNGQSIGRYWPANLAPSTGCTKNCDYRGTHDSDTCLKNCGEPAQTLYHIPRSWVHTGENVLVLHEELGGDPTRISLSTRRGQEICAHVAQDDPPPADTWKPNAYLASRVPEVRLSCEQGWSIASISFASFGTPQGHCGNFTPGSCQVDVLSAVKEVCIGKQECSVPVKTELLGEPCTGLTKSLAIQALCTIF